ncbi:hypothetical protein D3C71_1967800 [compost metagenome]
MPSRKSAVWVHSTWLQSSMAMTASMLGASTAKPSASLVRRRPSGVACSMSSASAWASACSSASGATWLTRPSAWARCASMKRPVSRNSAATELPTMRGRK